MQQNPDEPIRVTIAPEAGQWVARIDALGVESLFAPTEARARERATEHVHMCRGLGAKVEFDQVDALDVDPLAKYRHGR